VLVLIRGWPGETGSTTARGGQAASLSFLGEFPMSSISLLADHEAETINGGWFTSLFYKSFSSKGVTNNLSQINSAVNIGSGFGGLSFVANEQINMASITSVIG
jgi:hypothetical protein